MALEDAMKMAATMDNDAPMTDISQPMHEVEVLMEQTGNFVDLWVNVEGRCRLRITRIPQHILRLNDNRRTAV